MPDEALELRSPGRSATANRLSFSIVIEWENEVLAEAERGREMLRRLWAQLGELARAEPIAADIVVVYDPADLDEAVLRATVPEFGGRLPVGAELRMQAVSDSAYYGLKNAGAQAAQGDILIFLDSDVIPEPGWLAGIVRAFERAEVDVVAGATYVAPEGLYSAAVSLFWFFSSRDPAEGLVEGGGLFANNIAFRRRLFLDNPFPAMDRFRGPCGTLLRRLRAAGHGVYLQQSARCSHPPPNGVRHFLCRVICEGYDNYMDAADAAGPGSRPPFWLSYWSLHSRLPATWRKIRRGRRQSGASLASAGLAVLLAATYYATMVAGELMTRASPAFVRRHFAI